MSKKITSFLLGTAALVAFALPTQAQSQQRLEQIQNDLLKMKKSTSVQKETARSEALMKAKAPNLFRHITAGPVKKSAVMQTAEKVLPRNPFRVSENGRNQMILKAANTKLIANIAYFPGIQAANERMLASFTPANPTVQESLLTGNYTFYNCGALQDGIYYGGYIDTSYISWGYWWMYINHIDTETWEQTGSDYLGDDADDGLNDFRLVADEVATAADGTIYGAFWNAEGNGYELGIVDYSTLTRTTIGTLNNPYVALGITKAGVLYGVANDGNLYKIDTATAEETLVGPTGVTVSNDQGQYYYQGGEIDQKDDTFYWFGTPVDQGINNLYSVNLETGAATLLQELGEYTIVGVTIDNTLANENVPAKVDDLAANFANGSTTGTVSFTLPTKSVGGADLAGELTWIVKDGDEVLATGKGAPGAAVTAEVTAPEGMQIIKVLVQNEAGDGQVAKTSLWIGFDIPYAPASVTFTVDAANLATITWDAVTEGTHGGFLGDITYDVYRYEGEERALLAENLTATTITDQLTPAGLAVYKYGVIAKNGILSSAITISDGQAIGNALEPPYTADLTAPETIKLFTVIDANGDNSTWSYNITYSKTAYRYSSSSNGDDWLITPPINLKAGKAYNVIVNASAYGPSFPERMEVKIGKAATAEAMTSTVIAPTEVTQAYALPEDYEGNAQIDEDGTYYIGIHAISDADQFYLFVNSFTIEAGPEATAPRAVTDLAVTPDAEGLTAATITFTAPSLNIGGEALAENITVTIYRDNELIATLDNVAPGSAQSYDDVDEALTIGTHTYQVFVANASGAGLKSEKVSAYIGVDTPRAVQNLLAADGLSTVKLTWDKVTEGVNGGIVIPEKVDYIVWSLVNTSNGLEYDQQLDSLRDANSKVLDFNTNEGDQRYEYWAVQSKNDAGAGQGSAAALIVGKSFELPIEEHFAGQKLEIPGWFYGTDGSTYTSGWYQYYNVSLSFADDSSDGDGTSMSMTTQAPETWGYMTPGKLKVAGVTNPTLIFDVKSTSRTNQWSVVVETYSGETEVAVAPFVPTEDWQSVKLDLSKYAGEEYILVNFFGDFAEVGTFYFDNINFVDFLEYNLSSTKLAAPRSITAGGKAKVNFTVKNMGQNEAKSYKVKVSVADEVILDETVNEPLASLASKNFEATYKTDIFTEAGDKNVKAEVTFDLDLNEEDNVIEDVITVAAPTAAGVENLTAEALEKGYKVSWQAPTVVAKEETEDFENTEAFPTFDIAGITADNHEGHFGDWKVYDADGQQVYGWESASVSYENSGKPNAWMPFDPVKAGFADDYYPAVSGSQFLMAQCAAIDGGTVPSDDWLISPELPGIAQTISFYASQASTTDTSNSQSFYGFEKFEILASSTDDNIESFVKVGEGQISEDTWARFSYDLPEGTRYFAIRHTSVDVFALFIDDITYTVGGGTIESYNVYVDEQLVGNIAETSIDLKDLAVGGHKVSVTIIYASGVESAPVSIDVTVTAIEEILKSGQPVDIYTLDGVLVRQQATSAAGLKAGVYIVNGQQAIVK